MGLNWSKGLIAAGSGLKEYSAIKAKEEYMDAQTKAASFTGEMGRYGDILDSLDSEINAMLAPGRIGDLDKAHLGKLRESKRHILDAIRTGTRLESGVLNKIVSTTGAGADKKKEDGTEESWVEAAASFVGKYGEIGWEFLKEQYLEAKKDQPAYHPLSPGEDETKQIIKWAKEHWDSLKGSIETHLEKTNPGNGTKDTTQQPDSFLPVGVTSSGGVERGLIAEGEIAADELAALDQRFSAGGISDPGSTAQAGIGMTEEELTQQIKANTVQQDEGVQQAEQLNKYIGSEEALSSLGAIGGPVAEPAGESTIVEFIIGKPSSKIKVSSPEVEEKKSISISNALGAIRNVESNANGYTAVKGSEAGDRGLTTSTVGAAVKKHKDKAIGIGQFKYKEFMVPTAKKWFGMTEAQLKKQILTPQFQDALVIAGLYDAGLEQYAEGSINLDQFQKRIANIWRGLPPDKDTKKGDVTDKYGNIAGMSGADLQNRMQKGLLSN
jgi:hypothetical protein